MQPPDLQHKINVCATIKCSFFDLKSNSERCPRYGNACQCHLNTVGEVLSDGSWLFTDDESKGKQLKKVNDRFLSKDKASQQLLKQLTNIKASQTQGNDTKKQVSSTLSVEMPTGG